jgi:protein required for attachment to host cells
MPGTAESRGDDITLETDARRLGDIMADKPGRSFSSGARGRRSAMAYGSDPVRADQEAFVRRVVDLLSTRLAAGEFASLALFAEPRILGILRDVMPGPLAHRLVAERPLNHLPGPELAQAISRALEKA